MDGAKANRLRRLRNAWVGLALTLALHITDEALTGFLPVYNWITSGVRNQYPWIPLPTFSFSVWLTGLILGVLLLLVLTPLVARGNRWMRLISMALAVIMAGNALLHMSASIYWGKAAPGVYSSPLLLMAAAALFVTALRSKASSTPE